jgi:hypothetical protein
MIIPKKKIVGERTDICLWTIDGYTLEEAIQYLRERADGMPEGSTFEWSNDDPGDRDEEKSLKLVYMRDETDEEAKARQDSAQLVFLTRQRIQEHVDRRAYDELHKRFGQNENVYRRHHRDRV